MTYANSNVAFDEAEDHENATSAATFPMSAEQIITALRAWLDDMERLPRTPAIFPKVCGLSSESDQDFSAPDDWTRADVDDALELHARQDLRRVWAAAVHAAPDLWGYAGAEKANHASNLMLNAMEEHQPGVRAAATFVAEQLVHGVDVKVLRFASVRRQRSLSTAGNDSDLTQVFDALESIHTVEEDGRSNECELIVKELAIDAPRLAPTLGNVGYERFRTASAVRISRDVNSRIAIM